MEKKEQIPKDNLKELEILRQEIAELKIQLLEATELIDAIRNGEVDALVVKSRNGSQLYTLKTADESYRIFIEQMTEGAITLNNSGHILYSNSQFASMVQTPMEQVVGTLFLKFVQLEDWDNCTAMLQKAWNDSVKMETILVGPNAERMPVQLSLKVLHLDEGPSLSVIITDLTLQKNAQQLLERRNKELNNAHKALFDLNSNLESIVQQRTSDLENTIIEKTVVEQRLTRILDTMAEGVGIVDKNGMLTYTNQMAEKIFEMPLVGLNIYQNKEWSNQQIDGTPLAPNDHPLYITLQTGQPVYDQEISVQCEHRELFYISINAAPITDPMGEVIGGIATFTDVTKRRKALQQKDDFISVASHELRTPISTLKISLQYLDRIKNDPGNVLVPLLIEKSNKSLDRVTTLINDLLNVSKISQGQLQLEPTDFDLHALVQQSVEQLNLQGSPKVKVRSEDVGPVHADPDRVGQVVINMLSNALKYAPNGDNIQVEITRHDEAVKCSITDKGPGIPSDKVGHLFERYYRAEEGGQASGFGLGLYICAQIIHQHRGEIGVDSEPGIGSTFWFTLPQAAEI